MTEFIGSRISLISKRDIRYVGTLHEISSENSTVALEQVASFGTEGRRPDDEVAPSDTVYEYIVFRGSDVKDLRIEETPKENKPPKPPQVPDDPAILGSARRETPSASKAPVASSQTSPTIQQPSQQQQPPNRPQQGHEGQLPPHFHQQPQPPFYYPPANQRFGPQGFTPSGPPGYPGMHFGPPPGWYPPPGQGFHPQMPLGPFHPNQMPIGPPGQVSRQDGPHGTPPVSSPPSGNQFSNPSSQRQSPALVKQAATVKLPSTTTTTPAPSISQKGPPPPTESKPDVAAALAPPVTYASQAAAAASKSVPNGPRSGRIMPAIPHVKSTANGQFKPSSGNPPDAAMASQAATQASAPTANAAKSLEDANRDARAAVAAAMAKLPPAPGAQKKQTNGDSGVVDNLTKKVNEMRTNDNVRTSRQPGTGGYVAGYRGGRGTHRGGRPQADHAAKKVEVPTSDYDFESANAKFNKQDLVKEAIATGSPIESHKEAEADSVRKESDNSIPSPIGQGYNKTSSFFDNISSEMKDRDEGAGKALGGREFRNEERSKNFETFGQGSVDTSYRGGYRGRGRGRGGRGFARGGPRGSYNGSGGRGGGIRDGGRGVTVATEG